jgi:hypothetical protein
VLVSSDRNPYVQHGRLVPDVVPVGHDTDKSLPHVKLATAACDTPPVREAILRDDRRGLLSTIARMFSRVFIVFTTCLSEHHLINMAQGDGKNKYFTTKSFNRFN